MSPQITGRRDGKTVATDAAAETNKNKVIAAMVGREVSDIFPKAEHQLGYIALEIKNLTCYSVDNPDKKLVDDDTFGVSKVEVLVIEGLMGAGRPELLLAVRGAWEGVYWGWVL